MEKSHVIDATGKKPQIFASGLCEETIPKALLVNLARCSTEITCKADIRQLVICPRGSDKLTCVCREENCFMTRTGMFETLQNT